MNPNHQAFLREYMRHGDKDAAYKKAYPRVKESSVRSAANRLLQQPHIRAVLDKHTEEATAEAKDELKDVIKEQLLGIEQAKELLQSIIRGTHVTYRTVRVKDGFEQVEVYPSHAQILRALNMYLKLADLYPKPERKSGSGKAEEQKEEEEEFDNYWIMIGDKPFDPVEGTKYAQWYPLYYAGILWNPTKPNERAGWLKYMNTLSEEERAPFMENVRQWDEEQEQKIKNINVIAIDSEAISRQHVDYTATSESLNSRDCFVAEPPRNDGSGGPLNHTAASHQISPLTLRNDGPDVKVQSNNKNQQQITTNPSPPPEDGPPYITFVEAAYQCDQDYSKKSTHYTLWSKNLLNKLAKSKRPIRRVEREHLWELGWQTHPTDPKLVRRRKNYVPHRNLRFA